MNPSEHANSGRMRRRRPGQRSPLAACVALLGALAVGTPALAAQSEQAMQPGWFFGGGLRAPAESSRPESYLDGVTFADPALRADPGWKLFGGYRFAPQWSVEAAYVDDTGAHADEWNRVGSQDLAPPLPYAVQGFSLAGSRRLDPAGDLSLFGGVGLFGPNAGALRADAALPLYDAGRLGGMDLTYGFGGEYAAGDHLSLSAGWQRYSFERDAVDLFSAGLRYRFK